MINIAVLLLIFFLMSATVAAPPPFSLELPKGEAPEDAGVAEPLFVGADGSLVLGDLRGEAAMAALSARPLGLALELRADARVPAAEIAALLSRLRALGIGETRLVLERP